MGPGLGELPNGRKAAAMKTRGRAKQLASTVKPSTVNQNSLGVWLCSRALALPGMHNTLGS
jgi:hypothetical protein